MTYLDTISHLQSTSSGPVFAIAALTLVPFFAIVYFIIESKRANLSHIPGPFLARYTGAWHLFQAWRVLQWGGKVEFQKRLRAQYGDVVRVGPRSVMAFDAAAVPIIYGVRVRLDKGPAYIPLRQPGVKASLVSIRDEKTHGQYRKLVSNAFSSTSLKGYEPYIDEMINRFLEVKPLGFMSGKGQDAHNLIEHVKTFGRYILFTGQMPWLHTVFRENPIMRRASPAPFMRIVRGRVSERLDMEKNPVDNDESRPDLLSHFIATHKINPLMTRQNVAVTSATNLVAGGLSPGGTVDCLCRFLAYHPDAQEKLFTELSQAHIVVPASFDGIKELPYLDGVIREALRLHGSSTLGLQRITGPAGLQLPGGIHLPANTMVACSPNLINHDPRVWGSDADLYKPERWLKRHDETEEAHEERRRHYGRVDLTFGSGSRVCIGKSVAMLEIFKVVASLVVSFQFEFLEEARKGEVLVRVHARKRA